MYGVSIRQKASHTLEVSEDGSYIGVPIFEGVLRMNWYVYMLQQLVLLHYNKKYSER